jgi:serine protease AprX
MNLMSHSRRRTVAAIALTAVGALGALVGTAPAGVAASTRSTTCTGPSDRMIVRLDDAAADLAAMTTAVEACDGTVHSVQAAVGTAVVSLPSGALPVLRAVPGVLGVTADATVTPMALTFDPATQTGSMTNVTRISGANKMWLAGWTGAGVDVALIDTGVAPVPALADKAKVVVGPDLSFESQDPDLRYLDTFGHGTHMGSIIAGREVAKGSGATYANDRKNFYGMAPDSRLVSVKVGANDGAVDVSQLIAAIDWVVQNRNTNGLNIKVLNLSFGTDSTQSWTLDPLSQAAEVATRAGILVVTSGGNDGENARGLATPANNPHVMAIGAVDTMGTDALGDDQVPTFSQHADSALASRKPDLVAPGVRIVAPAVPGSTLAAKYPSALVGGGKYIRGSGTSQAAAVVSGAAALLWQKWPNTSPVQIREMLVDSTDGLGGITSNYEGQGELDMGEAVGENPASSARSAADLLDLPSTTATGTGTLQAARGSQSLTIDGVTLSGEKDIFGNSWSSSALAGSAATYSAWLLGTGTFNGAQWVGSGFATDTTTVAGQTWSGRSWAGRSWAGNAWSGRSWAGRSWAGRTWAGGTWAGADWTDPVTLSDANWSSRTWASRIWS